MKLFSQYNRINLSVTVLTMLVTGIIYYYTISSILTNQVDKALLVEEREVFDYVKLNHHLPQVFRTNHQEITFAAINHPVNRRFTDTTYRDIKDHDLEPARAIITQVVVRNQRYKVMVIQSKVETEYLIKIIFLITTGLIVAVITILFFINRVILSRIWKPFYKILKQLKSISLAENKLTTSIPSNIDEFTALDQAVGTMATRIQEDYQNLKAFTENAAHELMTPIAVINSKLDTLVQTGEFSQQQSNLLTDIYDTVGRLTRLNKSMLLLSKIENKLILDQQKVNIKDLLSATLYQYEELFEGLHLQVTNNIQDCHINASRLLMEVLLNNLVGNAIRHNQPGGIVSVRLRQQKLTISNTGKPGALDINQLFKRFQKSSDSEGIGLGLTICKQICDNSGFALSYKFINHQHNFTVSF